MVMGSKRMVGAIIRSGRRSSFLSNYLMFTPSTNPSLYHALVVIFLEFFAWGLLTMPMISVLSKTFPENTFLYNGLIMGVKGFLSFLSAPLIGGLSDLWGRKFFLLLTVLFTCLPIPFMSINANYYFVLVILSGIFSVTFSVIFAYVADVTDEHERTFAYGSVSATFALSLVTSPALGSYLSVLYGDDLVIGLATLVAAFDVFFILFFVPESLPEKLRLKSISFCETADPFASLRKAGKDRMILTLCVAVFLSYLPEAGQYSCFFIYLKLLVGFSSIEVASYIAIVGVLSIFAQTVLLSYIIRRFGAKNSITIGLIFEMLQLICYGLGSNLWVIWGAGIIVAVSSLTYPAISAYVSNYADADKQGLVQGIITGIRGLCNGLGPCAFGLVFNLFGVDLSQENRITSTILSPSAVPQHLSPIIPKFNSSLSSHIYGLWNATFVHHHLMASPNEKLIPGPPFLFGALLVLLAILVMAFIPELIQYPPASPSRTGEHSYSAAGAFKSAINRTIMSPSRCTPRTLSTSSNNYYYKSIHHQSLPDDGLDIQQQFDSTGSGSGCDERNGGGGGNNNAKFVMVYPHIGKSDQYLHQSSQSSPLQAFIHTDGPNHEVLYHKSTSCTLSCSESEDPDRGSTDEASSDELMIASDEDHILVSSRSKTSGSTMTETLASPLANQHQQQQQYYNDDDDHHHHYYQRQHYSSTRSLPIGINNHHACTPTVVHYNNNRASVDKMSVNVTIPSPSISFAGGGGGGGGAASARKHFASASFHNTPSNHHHTIPSPSTPSLSSSLSSYHFHHKVAIINANNQSTTILDQQQQQNNLSNSNTTPVLNAATASRNRVVERNDTSGVSSMSYLFKPLLQSVET